VTSGDLPYRSEAGRMVAALTRVFGIHNLALAEDVVHDAFCRALEMWKYHGVPENPQAWLMRVARNRALDVLRRERTARAFAPDLGRLLHTEWTVSGVVAELFDDTAIADDQLRMMFSCCHPKLPQSTQAMLILQLLCGFGAREIAAGFVSEHGAVERRLSRAKRTLAESGPMFDIADREDFARRLPAVLDAVYLLFNEGYHSTSDRLVRSELCNEALRLARLLADHPIGASAETRAFCALVCLHAARIPGRLDGAGHLVSLREHDRTRWNGELVREGQLWLERSACGTNISRYHLEAAIAWHHAVAARFEDTDWTAIGGLYDALMRIAPSPVVALNRAIAVGQRDGPRAGIAAIEAIAGDERLKRYPFYHAALGEFYLDVRSHDRARRHFAGAVEFARTPRERARLQLRLDACTPPTPQAIFS
jgi:RNA polymerase sigma factor (sigma-70 family)